MTSRKKIVFQAAGISAVLTFVGLAYNAFNLSYSAPYVTEVVATDIRVRSRDAAPMPPEDVRVVEEREYTPEWREEAERGAATLDRSGAMKRVEDIHEELQQDLYPEDRAVLEREKFLILSEYFDAAAGEEPPGGDMVAEEPPPEFGEPKNGDGKFGFADIDINNIFNKVWGLLQALVVAWATLKFQQNKKQKKEDWLTDSTMDKIDEKLAAKYRTDRIKHD